MPGTFIGRAARKPALVLLALLASSCGGGGGGGGSAPSGGSAAAGSPAPSSETGVTISGIVSFERVGFGTMPGQGLQYGAPLRSAARGITVEAVGAGGETLASGSTDDAGRYSLSVPAGTNLFVRARAELRRAGAPGWSVSVRDNTAGNAVYVLDGAPSDSGSAPSIRDLHASAAPSASGQRAAGPFALLDTVWQAQQLVLAADGATSFPELRIYWSVANVPCDEGPNGFCNGTAAALGRGEIATTFFQEIAGQGPSIYVLGALASDSDEFDAHVIAHEWGHYYQHAFSRDDSLGGEHSLSQRLDPRVAFSEGWGNAFAGMVHNDAIYRDSFGANGSNAFTINVEDNAAGGSPGWFSEASVQSIIWDVFDQTSDGADTVTMGFAPLHSAMRGPVRTTNAFTTMFAWLNGLRSANPTEAGGLDALATAQLIAAGSDDFGSAELVNSGGDSRNLPIFPLIDGGETRRVCSSLPGGSTSAVYNKLGNRRFLRFALPVSGNVSLAARNGPPGSDPDIVLYSAGAERGRAEGTQSGTETLTLALGAGSYVAEIYEFSNVAGSTPRGDTCFDVQLSVS